MATAARGVSGFFGSIKRGTFLTKCMSSFIGRSPGSDRFAKIGLETNITRNFANYQILGKFSRVSHVN